MAEEDIQDIMRRHGIYSPHAQVRMMNKAFTEDQRGQPIRDADVITAANGMYFTDDEINRFRERSSDHCPTYGNCPTCFRTGAIGTLCIPCENTDHYQATFYRDNKAAQGRRILDAKYVTRLMEASPEFQVPLADRRYQWLRTPCFFLNSGLIGLWARRLHPNDKEAATAFELKVYDGLEFN